MKTKFKKYSIQILTPEGVKVLTLDQSKQTLAELEEETKRKFGLFITLKSEIIK